MSEHPSITAADDGHLAAILFNLKENCLLASSVETLVSGMNSGCLKDIGRGGAMGSGYIVNPTCTINGPFQGH